MGWFNRTLQGEKVQIWQQIGIFFFFQPLYFLLIVVSPSVFWYRHKKVFMFLVLPDRLCSGWFIILHYAAGIIFFLKSQQGHFYIHGRSSDNIQIFFCATFGLNSRDAFKSDYIRGGGGTFARSRDFMAQTNAAGQSATIKNWMGFRKLDLKLNKGGETRNTLTQVASLFTRLFAALVDATSSAHARGWGHSWGHGHGSRRSVTRYDTCYVNAAFLSPSLQWISSILFGRSPAFVNSSSITGRSLALINIFEKDSDLMETLCSVSAGGS